MRLLAYLFYFFYQIKRTHSNADACWLINNFPFSGSKKRKIINQANPGVASGTSFTPPIYIENDHQLVTGEKVFINADCHFNGAGKVVIGSNSLIGPRVIFCTANHSINSVEESSYQTTVSNITIGENVWIGAGVIICPGVTIESNSIIAAGSVVTKNIAEYVLAAGVPCTPKRNLPRIFNKRL